MAAACALLGTLAGCTVDRSPTPDGPFTDPDGDAGADGAIDGGMDAAMPPPSLLEGPTVERLSSLTLDERVVGVELAGPLVLARHGNGGASLIDLSDPREPKVASRITTEERVVAVRYDHVRKALFVLTASGELRALRATDPTALAELGSTQLPVPEGDEANAFRDLARAGDRLFALTASHIVPVRVAFDDAGGASLTATEAAPVGGAAQRIATSGTGLYVAIAGGVIRAFSAGSTPAPVDEVELGGEIVGWSVRGQRLWVALEGVGVRALWFRPGEPLDVEARAGELSDVQLMAQSGQVLAAALDRGRVALLDVSQTGALRGFAVHEAEVPDWLAVAGGNLLLGSGDELQVIGAPPIVEAGVPASVRDAAPRHGRMTLLFSKPLDPETVTLESITMRCDGRVVSVIPHLDLDAERVALLPTGELPASASCEIRLRGVRDPLGLTATGAPSWLSFEVNDGLEGFVNNGPSSVEHTAEGRMTGWTRGAQDGFEYFDIAPAEGVNGNLYVDFDGERLWLYFDAVSQRDVLYADCAAVFAGFVASGATRFAASIRGDQRIEASGVEAVGGYAYGSTIATRDPHGSFELALEAARGGFAVQIYLPSGSRGCELSEREPVVFSGMCDEGGCTLDGRGAVDEPATPTQLAPAETADLTPELRFNVSNALMSLPEARVELLTQGEAPRTVLRTTTYGSSVVVPAGVLERGTTYDLRVTAHNVAGFASATRALTVLADEP